jgi:H+/Cl- antiporter ClcA
MKLEKFLRSSVLILSLLISAAVFIIAYCHIFDEAGLAAKKRLLDYPLLTFFITPFFFWISAYLCRRYSPNASGHHLQSAINQLKKDSNSFEKVSDFLNVRLVIVKTVSSLISSFGGGSLGKEGPSVHMSAGIFAVFADRYKRFLPKINLETWVLAGGAIGLTLAFNAPFAGIIFASEKLFKMGYKNFKESILFVTIFVIIVSVMFHTTGSMFLFREVNFVASNWWPIIFTATICGLLAYIFKSICNQLYITIRDIKSNSWHLIPVGLGLVVAGINFYSGIFSFSGGIQTVQQVLSSDSSLLSYKEVGGRIINTILTFSSGSAGGLIAPALAIGAGIGSIANTLAQNADIGIFLLVGMAAFLSVVLGEPITAAIIVFETMGQSVQTLPFLLIATIVSLATWKIFEKNIQKLVMVKEIVLLK